jgi:hypothetical protein
MRLYETVAVTTAATLLLSLIVRRAKTLGAMKLSGNRESRLLVWATVAPPLFLAAIIVIGLVLLSARNLTGESAIEQASTEHATAIHNLFFRRQ